MSVFRALDALIDPINLFDVQLAVDVYGLCDANRHCL